MSSLGSPSPFLIAGKKSYTVGRSLRFNDGDSPWLQRTVSSSSNRRTFTISAWVKRSTLGSANIFGQTDSSGSYMFYIVFDSSDQLYILDYDYPSNNYHFVTNRRFKDTTAWYHIVLAVDTTQATNTNRSKLYVNGVQETSFGTAIYFDQNHDTYFNSTSPYPIMRIGLNGWGYGGANCYLAEFNAIDGLQLTPSSFAETNAVTGQWIAKKYVGSYGTNGFRLKFADNSGTTATTLGKDSSGNGNNLTPNNFSVSAGEGNDSVEDTPTSNYPTWNPRYTYAQTGGTTANSNGNLKLNTTTNTGGAGTYYPFGFTTFGAKSGKWYAEFKCDTTYVAVGVANTGQLDSDISSNPYGASANTSIIYTARGYVRTNSSNTTSSVPTYGSGDIIGVALDIDNNKIYFHKNGTYIDSGNPSTGSNGFAFGNTPTGRSGDFVFSCGSDGVNSIGVFANLGQQAFSYSIPTGYKKLNSANLPDPTIKKPNQYFDTLLYTGNGSSPRTISGLEFQPDFVWLKDRSASNWHRLQNSVVGANKLLYSNSTNQEATDESNGHINAFTSDGFILDDASGNAVNGNNSNFVTWNWDAGETDSKTYTVTVVNDGGNKYRFDGFGTSAVTITLAKGGTYTFNYPSAHPLRFSTTSDGTHGGGSEYTSGVSTYGNSITITVASNAPTLYYYCSQHSGMGGQVNTYTTLGSTNFDGSTQANVKVNQTSGFSIITWTGTGSNLTIGHGLGVKPSLHITKARSGSSGCPWFVYFGILGANSNLRLNTESAVNSGSGQSDLYNDTEPTNSVITIGNSSCINENGGTYVTYAFAEVAGYSQFGSYKGNGSSNGTFVYLGFKPAFLIIRASSTSGKWIIVDNKRTPSNPVNKRLKAESNSSEDSSYRIFSFLANGFKLEDQYDGEWNGNGATFVYLAFAESPFKYANAR